MNACKKSQIFIMIAITVSVLMVSIEFSGTFVVLPVLSKTMHIHASQLNWIVSLYLLIYASLIVIGGRLGDLNGHKNILLIGLGVFIFGSLLAGMSFGFKSLLLGRALQSLGAAFVWPNTTAIAFSTLPENKKGLAIGIVSAAVGLGLALGPLVAGAIIAISNWRWFFLFNVPLGLITTLMIFAFLKNIKQKVKPKLDLIGAVLLALVLSLIILAVEQLPLKAEFHHYDYWYIALAILFMVVFFFIEKKTCQPIIPSQLIKNKAFIKICIMRVLTVMPLYANLMIIGLYGQQVLHMSPLSSSLIYLPMTICVGLLSTVGGKLLDRYSACKVLRIAIEIYTAGFIVLAFLPLTNVKLLAVVLVLPGVAFALASPAVLMIATNVTPIELKGAVTGVFYMVSLTGGLIAITIATLIIQFVNSKGTVTTHAMHLIYLCLLLSSVVAMLFSFQNRLKPN